MRMVRLKSLIAICSAVIGCLRWILFSQVLRSRNTSHLEVICAHNVAYHPADHLVALIIRLRGRVIRVMIDNLIVVSFFELPSVPSCGCGAKLIGVNSCYGCTCEGLSAVWCIFSHRLLQSISLMFKLMYLVIAKLISKKLIAILLHIHHMIAIIRCKWIVNIVCIAIRI